MKYLSLELAKHPLLIQAFTGEDGKFTTEKVWFEDPDFDGDGNPATMGRPVKQSDIAKGMEFSPREDDLVWCLETMWIPGNVIASAADLEELLGLAWELKVIGRGDALCTESEKKLKKELKNIAIKGGRLTRLAESIIAVLEERQ